ncbi:hypothetical protein [Niveispirillum sp.]|uniref:hypothetical protein n=1 Tax=Niveispirillum sp. TaxID=1917217 RepID=UPI001B727396|nr:hypothetical protein [Niveispirillum sp.]MBP7336901.1 hypothetical protein [Niveispirillum sp.]
MDSDLLPADHDDTLPPKSRVLLDIAAERTRQDTKWGGPAHDDANLCLGDLAIGAAAYTLTAWTQFDGPPDRDISAAARELAGRSPCNHKRDINTRTLLVRAAALIVAEIERLDRQAIRTKTQAVQL